MPTIKRPTRPLRGERSNPKQLAEARARGISSRDKTKIERIRSEKADLRRWARRKRPGAKGDEFQGH